MIDLVLKFIMPAAYSLLPPQMSSLRATAMLLAIGLQESRFEKREQIMRKPGVPPAALGFWQFEAGGSVVGVLSHPKTRDHAKAVLAFLQYPSSMTVRQVHEAIEHNDILACAFARLNLWWIPDPLPHPGEGDLAWLQYLEAWNPGAPHPGTWPKFYEMAWSLTVPVVNLDQRKA